MLIVLVVVAWLGFVQAQEHSACPPGSYLLADRVHGCADSSFGRRGWRDVD